MMMGTDWGFGWGGMWFGWFMMIGLAAAVVVLIVWLVKLFVGNAAADSGAPVVQKHSESALDILQARYARGEMSKEEYLDARATLGT